MPRSRRAKSTSAFDTITLEGGLISSAVLAQIAERRAGNQTEADYGVPKGLTIRDEIARYYRIAAAMYKDFTASANPSAEATVAFAEGLLRDVLGFSDIERHKSESGVVLQGKKGRVPVVVVPPDDELDRASALLAGEGRRRSAASALQDWLSHQEQSLWGFCTNGEQLRLTRHNASLTRPAFVEVRLRQIFEGENFADFAAAWLLCHATRFSSPDAPAGDCYLERWREAGTKEGLVARDRLRDGVEAALLTLGNGFVSHPDNTSLRTRLADGELALSGFFGQLLRLIYRMIFLLVAEDRKENGQSLLHPPDADASACKLYAEGYSIAALRDHAVRRTAWDRHHDRWEGLLITFCGLATGQPKLGLPGLGGLFDNLIPDLDSARLSNRALMEAVYRLAWLKDEGNLVPVNWRDMETEELGSVYESLLELTPILVDQGRGFDFAKGDESKGHQRKTTGSYYTPDSLVQTLLDSALDPVLDRVESESADRIEGLLGVTVIDPACGSGHFLLAAARRIATRVARARTGGVASTADYRHALRDVVRSCIHGVDRNSMAVELTKVALWIETVEPGKPLGFLDASILCGDSLLGVFDLDVLRQGIPDAAFKPLAGDDRDAARYFDRRNKGERDGQGTLDFTGGKSALPSAPPLAASLRAVRVLPEDSTSEIAEKKKQLAAAKSDRRLWNWRVAANLYVAAFLLSKKDAPLDPGSALVPTTDHIWRTLLGGQVYGPLVGVSCEATDDARVFHWPLEFPDVMAGGGFHVVLGNPPWERIKLQEQEFFASREPDIAMALNADARGKMIAGLKGSPDNSRSRRLFEEFQQAKHTAEASSVFVRESGRFPLTGQGDVNTYALFAELFECLVKRIGRAGIVIPTGIATDATSAPFFSAIVAERRLISLHDFQTGLGYFDRIGHARFKFALLTLGGNGVGPIDIPFSFFSRTIVDFADTRRHYTLRVDEIARINPNTRTAPIFRTKYDAELTAKLHRRVPILIEDGKDGGNPWGISFMRMFDMANDSGLFLSEPGALRVPLLEAKMIHQFDHRWCSYERGDTRELTPQEKCDPSFEPTPRYWVDAARVQARVSERNWTHQWLIGWRDICRATDERTLIAAAFPLQAVGHTTPLLMPSPAHVGKAGALIANLSSLVFDYVVRQKVGGTHLVIGVLKQLPVLAPTSYRQPDAVWIRDRVLELVYVSHSMSPLARDLGHEGRSFAWNEERRSQLRAELDAWYARAYELTRDELRYILDPADVMGEDYPSETFRGLKYNEIKKYGEYRTRRLVLEAWDRLEAGDLK